MISVTDLSVSHIMASNSTGTTTSETPAAAEEPVLNGDDGHDERVHVPTKGTSTGKGKLKAGTKNGKGKGKDDATTYCANCGEEGDARCGGCGVVYYCRKNIVIKNGKKVNMCQQVSRSLNRTGMRGPSPFPMTQPSDHVHTRLPIPPDPRSTGSTVAIARPALHTSPRPPRRRSRIGCARRRSRLIAV